MNNILFIGNGFDLAHGLPTSWRDFQTYINAKMLENGSGSYCSKQFEDMLNEYSEDLKEYEFWSDVESYLGKKGEGCDSTESTIELIDFTKEFTLLFQKYLVEVEEILFPEISVKDVTKQYIDSFDIIVTANYTNTLEKLYEISSKKIIHIHGQIIEQSNAEISCIIGCDNSTFNNSFIDNLSPRKLGNKYKENPSYFCNTSLSKLGLTMSYFNSSEFMTETCSQYEQGIEQIKGLIKHSPVTEEVGYISSMGVTTEVCNITFWGYSFGESDHIINQYLVEQICDNYYFTPDKIKFVSYSLDKKQKILSEEIQEIIEDKLGYNSKYFKKMILFSEDYVEKNVNLKLTTII